MIGTERRDEKACRSGSVEREDRLDKTSTSSGCTVWNRVERGAWAARRGFRRPVSANYDENESEARRLVWNPSRK